MLQQLSNLLVDPVLVDGPHCGHVGVEELSERHLLAAGARADQPRLPHRVVAHQHAFHQLLQGVSFSISVLLYKLYPEMQLIM